ncbi:transmembrane protein 35B isoform X1 [Sminthopsis crassicaudata]|uniref:transmembrane protein 35B isoform X1 n=1 Tax=Sminthopsis crassicaudata TaxID=9301 RepID=UPI003D687C4B
MFRTRSSSWSPSVSGALETLERGRLFCTALGGKAGLSSEFKCDACCVTPRAQAAKLAHVLPLKSLGFNPDPGELLVIIGWVELVSGLLLVLGPPLLQDISIILLLLLSVGTVYSLLLLKEPVSSWAPPAICLGLLFLLSTRACHLF